jgi:hypothetical protein
MQSHFAFDVRVEIREKTAPRCRRSRGLRQMLGDKASQQIPVLRLR